MAEIILETYLIDTVAATESGKVKMVTYSVVGASMEEAVQKFLSDEEQDVVFYEGDETDVVVIGVEKKA